MAEENKVVLKPSGQQKPSIEEIAKNHKDYNFQIGKITISPTINIYKNNKIVESLDNFVLVKMPGSVNENYADDFLNDLVNDFLIGLISNFANKEKEENKGESNASQS